MYTKFKCSNTIYKQTFDMSFYSWIRWMDFKENRFGFRIKFSQKPFRKISISWKFRQIHFHPLLEPKVIFRFSTNHFFCSEKHPLHFFTLQPWACTYAHIVLTFHMLKITSFLHKLQWTVLFWVHTHRKSRIWRFRMCNIGLIHCAEPSNSDLFACVCASQHNFQF